MKKVSVILSIIFASLFSFQAFAGPQFVDKSGHAVSGFDVVSYWSLKQNAVGKDQPSPLPGKASITAEYNGAKWAFASEENKQTFLKDPAKYVPAYDGHCAYGVAQGAKVQSNPHLWRIVDGKLYLNFTKAVVGYWEQDISGNISKSEKKWNGLSSDASPNSDAPEFSSKAAPVQ